MKNFTNDDDKIKILLNVNILKEGINLPCADMIVFVETKFSQRLIIQNLGRVLRKKKDNNDALVYLPLFSKNELDSDIN